MGIHKLSVSMDDSIAAAIRKAAFDEGITVSAWIAAAAQDRIRNVFLRIALDADALEFGQLSDSEFDRLVADARDTAVHTSPNSAVA
jgi:hypothetical protein